MQKQPFSQKWQFKRNELNSNPWQPSDDSDAWRTLDLPHDWSIETERSASNPSGVSNGWFGMGRASYRKTFQAPETWRGKKVMVEFEGVYMNAEILLNGNYIGLHPYGYTSFLCDLTPYLVVGGENTLLVMVENSGQLNSRWYSGSGIYRPVWLVVAEPVHVAHWGLAVSTPEVSAANAQVHVVTCIENETADAAALQVHQAILAPDGKAVAQIENTVHAAPNAQTSLEQDLTVTQPQLWDLQNPHLYQVETKVMRGDVIIDTLTTPFGIRSIAWSAEAGFMLNGQEVKMKGGCVHHDNGVMGAASFPRSEERKVELLKASGYNAVRCAHNPPAPAFLDACDRLGMLVIDETFDCWRTGKNPFDYHLAFDSWWERDTESMVNRDRNHPSVVVWSIGNEVLERDGRSNGVAIANMLVEKVRGLDATRPITCAICGVWDTKRTWEDTAPVFAALDIGGYNYQWRQYEEDHAKYPQRIMFGTETFPLEAFENWESVLNHSYVIGDFVWTSWDYLGESGIGRQHYDESKKQFLGDYPWHQAYCGDIDLAGFKRPQSYYRDIVWQHGAPLYIAVHTPIPEGKNPIISQWGWPDVQANWTWTGKDGKTFTVDVYSACEEVELFLNGQSLGRKPTGKAEKYLASFEVPYATGELKAVGYTQGTAAAETALQTRGEAAALRLTADRARIAADGDLSFITVEVVDADGNLQPNAENTIFFTAQGSALGVGEIAAVGSGNPISTESYRGNQRKAHQGRCVVVVKSTGQPGGLTLRAQADGLTPAETVIQVQ